MLVRTGNMAAVVWTAATRTAAGCDMLHVRSGCSGDNELCGLQEFDVAARLAILNVKMLHNTDVTR